MERLRRDPGLVALLVALVAAAALYAPVIGRGITNYDDTWLVRDNWIVAQPSWGSLHAIVFDLGRDTRYVLGWEYLPVRDLSVTLDHVLWGTWYGGHHLMSLVLYLGAIAAWFAAVCAFGIDRKIAGVMALVWALHPSHAESVAWLAERKGVLAALFAGLATLGYAHYRAGARVRWLALAMLAAVFAVWSKAPAAFAIAALAALELVLPVRRQSWRRSLVGLGAIAVVGIAAFVPVVLVATQTAIVGGADRAPAGWLAMAIGIHGFYVRDAAMAVSNAASYPIATTGPSAIDLVVGAVALAVALAVATVPARGRWRPPAEARAGAILWLACWFPVSRLVLPLTNVLVADRYLLLPTLGVALVIAAGVARIGKPRLQLVLVAAIAIAGAVRTIGAEANWRDSRSLWESAVASNPDDSNAWSMYSEALLDDNDPEAAYDAVTIGLERRPTARLLLRKALLILRFGSRLDAVAAMRAASDAGEPRAMANLALLLSEDGRYDEAIAWGRRATETLPTYAAGHRNHGKVALAAGKVDEALAAFERAYTLEPRNPANRYNLGLALSALGRRDEARAHFEACVDDPRVGPLAREALAHLR